MAWYNFIDNAADAMAARNEYNIIETKTETLKALMESTTRSIHNLIDNSESLFSKSYQEFEHVSFRAWEAVSKIQDATQKIETKKTGHGIKFNTNIIEKDKFESGAASILVAGSSGGIAVVSAYTAVGILGTASTGTAIGSLGGVAATNATLAWFGGGAIAAGGGGIVVGTAVLGGIVATPILFVVANQAKKYYENNKAVAAKYYKELEAENSSLLKQKKHINTVSDRIDKKVSFLDYASSRLIHNTKILDNLDIIKPEKHFTKSAQIISTCCMENIGKFQNEAEKVLSTPIVVDGEMQTTEPIVVDLDEIDIHIIKKHWKI
jgi:hypothetical protein